MLAWSTHRTFTPGIQYRQDQYRVGRSVASKAQMTATTAPSQAQYADLPLDAPLPGEVCYFAYGSNMSPKVLTDRRKVVPRASAAAVLDGFILSFQLRGLPYSEPGFGTIERATPSSDRRDVHGVVHVLTIQQWSDIMRSEGVSQATSLGYQVIAVPCKLYGGRTITALTLQAAPRSLHPDGSPAAPSRRYLELLLHGAKHYNLSPEYVSYLEGLPTYQVEGAAQKVGRVLSTGLLLGAVLPVLPALAITRLASGRRGSLAEGAGATAGVTGATATATAGGTDPPAAAAATATATVSTQAAVKQVQPNAWSSSSSSRDSSSSYAQSAATAKGAGPGVEPPAPTWVAMWFYATATFAWGVHDYLLQPVLGSGRYPEAGRGKQG